MRRSNLALLLPAALALLPGARAGDRAPGATPTIADYFGELERVGVIDRATGTRDTLVRDLDAAEAVLSAGDAVGAATKLYAIVESPRYLDFADSPEYQNAEYDLGVALALSGAYEHALDYLGRTLARGPSALYYTAAHRRAVDVAMETREHAAVLAQLETIKTNEPLPTEATGERAYLRARVAYDKGDFAAAEGELVKLSRKSRLYTAALYLRGVINTRKGAFDDATAALCEIVDTPDDDKFTFYVDERYFTLKDLARLGLGRIAHEEGRYDDAYYHYFQIPDDSEKLAEALFEAAWSMYQKRELGTARDLTAEFLKTFPDSPLVLEALLLAGYVELADCQFSQAEKRFAVVVKELQPVYDVAEAIRKSPARRREFLRRAITREEQRRKAAAAGERMPRATNAEAKVSAYLSLDPRFARLHDAAVGLRREAGQAEQAATWWRMLAARVVKVAVVSVAPEESAEAVDARKAAELARDVDHLLAETRGPDLADQRAALIVLRDRARAASTAADERLASRADPRIASFLRADLTQSVALAARARDLATDIDDRLAKLSDDALDRLHTDLRRVLDKAKLGKIDSVIGQKRKLELEIEDLAQGRYPPELYGKMYEDGIIADDEEYWPPEGEFWSDEYEGWR